ncbi:hypothetical protein [Pusillimonas sp.]|uniref:hypothetical protein n=1 Tax=Pusillimonas sp. TaxID=3040095 RepID=UPI0037CBCCD9
MNDLIKAFLAWLTAPAESSAAEPPTILPVSTSGWLSSEQFRKATGLSASKAQDWYPHVRAACLEFGIVGPVRVAAFLAQIGHESGSFAYTREIWGQQRRSSVMRVGPTWVTSRRVMALAFVAEG